MDRTHLLATPALAIALLGADPPRPITAPIVNVPLVTATATPTGSIRLQRITLGAISAKATARLRAAGLDPSSTGFADAFAARLGKGTALLGAHAKTIVASAAKLSLVSSKAPAIFKPIATSTVRSSTGGNLSTTLQRSVPVLVGGLGSVLTVGPMFSWLGPTRVSSTGTMPVPDAYYAPLFSNSTSLANSFGTVTIDVPACGVHAVADANFFNASAGQGAFIKNLIGGQMAPAPYYASFYLILGSDPIPQTPHPATFTFSFPNASTSPSQPYGVVGEPVYTTMAAVVGENGTLTSDGGMGLTTKNTSLANATVQRFNTGDTDIGGIDTFGTGVALGNGVTATATINSATSVADLGNDVSPDNAYRGAVISIQPQAHRLETQVHWHVSPGDSLSYTISWKFTGPTGQRVIDTLPLGGPCDS
jgi:hypothetical protein